MSVEAMKVHNCPHCEREFVCNHHEWVGLTDERIQEIWNFVCIENSPPVWNRHILFARAIEAKIKEKNHG